MRRIYIKKYKNFLPIEYVEEYNRKIKKKLNIYILLLLLFNLFFYGQIKTENNKIKIYLSEIKGVNSIYKNSLINYINKINGRVYDISLNESNNTYILKGELR